MTFTLDNLKTRTLNEVENLYSQGFVSQDNYEAYYHLWYTSNKDHLFGFHIACHCEICLPGGFKDE